MKEEGTEEGRKEGAGKQSTRIQPIFWHFNQSGESYIIKHTCVRINLFILKKDSTQTVAGLICFLLNACSEK